MPFPDYSDGGSTDRFRGPVESAVKNKASTGTPLTSSALQDIGRTIDDEIAKVAPPTPTKSEPLDTVRVEGASIGRCLQKGVGGSMITYTSQASTYDLINAHQSGSYGSINIPILVAKSTDGTTEIIRIASMDIDYAKTTGVDRYGWNGPPHGDDFTKWLSGIQARQLTIKKAQFTGDGKTLAITMYDTNTSSGTYYGDKPGLYQIYFHGSLDGSPYYDSNTKCWVGRNYNIDSALIVYTDPTNGQQYVTQIKK